MPIVPDFPVPAPYGTGPYINFFKEQPPEFAGYTQEYEDKGMDYNESAPAYIRRFTLGYYTKRIAEVAILDAHYLAAHGQTYGFTFTHPKTGEVITDCHYESYDYPDHPLAGGRLTDQDRNIVIVKRPVATT